MRWGRSVRSPLNELLRAVCDGPFDFTYFLTYLT